MKTTILNVREPNNTASKNHNKQKERQNIPSWLKGEIKSDFSTPEQGDKTNKQKQQRYRKPKRYYQ